ncbi:hypothetical protein ALC53_12744 [Atta colombica]|uniref:Uncharacterized protein n=1 Tax=Atta colombica TaxID=520822 RepID=A0A195AXU0_9HYME|nr:hypothetical protein ALC53_12744 [Atta colombica]
MRYKGRAGGKQESWTTCASLATLAFRSGPKGQKKPRKRYGPTDTLWEDTTRKESSSNFRGLRGSVYSEFSGRCTRPGASSVEMRKVMPRDGCGLKGRGKGNGQCAPHDKESDYWGGGRGAKQGYEVRQPTSKYFSGLFHIHGRRANSTW